MCNLFGITTGFQAMRDLFKGIGNRTNRTEFDDNIYPDYPAPIARKDADGEMELAMLRWGMPTPPAFLKGEVDYGVTNIRNVKSPHWRRWLGPESRCVVPATSFSEYGAIPVPGTTKKPLYWFALNEERPLFFFAGVWTQWHGTRKKKEGLVDTEIFAFLTTEPNAVVAPIHAKAMPVILRTAEEIDVWMNAPAEEALQLQRPLPDNELIVLPTLEAP
jgi:putative SOS response-associated peptidase YedK